MPEQNPEPNRSRPALLSRLWKWIDERTGADKVLRASLDEPIPGGARLAYVFGSALLFIFVSQIVTGLCLALYYVPSPLTAHASVAYIVKEVAAGSFLRSLHSYGSSAMVIVLVMHFLQTFLYGSYKGKRQLLWISGCTLSLLVLGMTFTGYLLSWDQSAYSAGSVGSNLLGQVPLIGNSLRLLLRGGPSMGALTLSRFYVLHVFIIPALIFLFIAAHILLFRKAGAAGPVKESPVTPLLPTETFYPKQVLIDMGFVLLVMGVLGMLAHFVPVTLGIEADPANTRFLPRPEWYFLPMFQWLKYWEGWSTVIGVFVIPVILIALFFLLPFLDRGLERRPWRRPIPVGGVVILLIGLVWLGMTSRLVDARDPAVASKIAEQSRAENVYFYTAFQPYSGSSASGATSSLLDATSAQGKGIFDSHGCSGCHGESGGGAVGPALTNISSKFPPAQLTALLKAPTSQMQAGGMVPLTLNSSEMQGLVSYLASLGGASAGSAATPPAAGSSSPASGVVQTAAGSAGAAASHGQSIFDSQRCSGCHGQSGGGGVGPALTHISSQYPPAKLMVLLKAPTAKMKAAGMVPLTLNAADMTALVSYVTGLGGTPTASPATPAAAGSPTPAAANAAPPPAAGSPSAAPANAQPATTAAPTNAPAGSPAISASATQGKGIFDSQKCSGCHGQSGGGGVGPALTHISTQYPPAKLTALLKAPTAKMKAAGMVPLTLKPADMKALVSYVTSLGGPSTAVAAAAPPAGSSSPAPASAAPAATAGAAQAPTSAAPAAAASPAPAPPAATPAAAGSPSPAPANAQPAANSSAAQGKGIFDSQKCSGCHGQSGGGGIGPALTHISSQYPPAKLTALLKAPTAKMKAAGMVPLTLNAADMKALVSYVTSLGGTPAGSAAPTPASGSSSPSQATTKPGTSTGLSTVESQGQAIFKAHGCGDCHGTGGAGGTSAAPGLAGTGKSLTPALVTTSLEHPTARMQNGGMPPVSLSRDELKALAEYVSSISASKSNAR